MKKVSADSGAGGNLISKTSMPIAKCEISNFVYYTLLYTYTSSAFPMLRRDTHVSATLETG